MKPRDIAIAVAVAAMWGFNFLAIKLGLDRLPPLLFLFLRFALAAFPAILLVKRPAVRWRWLIAYALTLNVLHFSLLFLAMAHGMPAGLSSLALQSQAIFTMLLAVPLLGERPRLQQVAGLIVAAGGLILVGSRLGADRPAAAFALVIVSASAWGMSNIVMRKAAPDDILGFVVWAGALAVLPLGVLSVVFEGPAAQFAALRGLDARAVGALGYVALISTLAGFGLWGLLMRRYGAGTVAPFSMLVPFFGMSSAAVFLGETLQVTDILGGALVIGGVLGGAWRRRPQSADQPPLPAPPLARGVTERSEGAPQGAPGITALARGVTERSEGAPQGAPGITALARGVTERSEGAPQGAPGITAVGSTA